jgi:hypothetical protein
MIDILYNKLGACNDVSLAEWKDIDPMIFCKHSQDSQASQHQHEKNKEHHNIIPKTQQNPIVCEEKAKPVIKTSNKTVPSHLPSSSQNKTNMVSQDTDVLSKTKKKSKDTTNKPVDIIMNESLSFHNSTDYIKEALITMISKEEFSKIFGLTKCAEIMSGIVNNRWNKSTALFISFLFDKEVYYNDKIVLYNKEKNIGRISIP